MFKLSSLGARSYLRLPKNIRFWVFHAKFEHLTGFNMSSTFARKISWDQNYHQWNESNKWKEVNQTANLVIRFCGLSVRRTLETNMLFHQSLALVSGPSAFLQLNNACLFGPIKPFIWNWACNRKFPLPRRFVNIVAWHSHDGNAKMSHRDSIRIGLAIFIYR